MFSKRKTNPTDIPFEFQLTSFCFYFLQQIAYFALAITGFKFVIQSDRYSSILDKSKFKTNLIFSNWDLVIVSIVHFIGTIEFFIWRINTVRERQPLLKFENVFIPVILVSITCTNTIKG